MGNLNIEYPSQWGNWNKKQKADYVRSLLPASITGIEKLLLKKNGNFIGIRLSRPIKVLKKSELNGVPVIKYSRFVCQPDIDYYKKWSVIQKHESGEREKRGLPESVIPLSKVLRFNENTKNLLFAFGTINNPRLKRQTKWFVDGKQVSKESILASLTSRDREPSKKDDWMYLNPDHILSIH